MFNARRIAVTALAAAAPLFAASEASALPAVQKVREAASRVQCSVAADGSTVYVGSANGGVWKIQSAGDGGAYLKYKFSDALVTS